MSYWEVNLQLEELYAHQANQQVDLGDHADENFSAPVFIQPSNLLYPQTTADVSTIFQLSTCTPPNPSSLLPNPASLAFMNLVDDHHLPLLHLSQLPPHLPFMGDLFQPPPFAGSSMVPTCGSVFGNYITGDHVEGLGAGMFIGDKAKSFENTFFEFGRDINARNNAKRARKGKKTFTTERDSRSQSKERYGDLRQLIPSTTKCRMTASVVGDVIQYVEKLKRRVNELKFLIDKKQCERERTMRQKMEDDVMDNGLSGDGDSSITKLPMGNSDNQSPYGRTDLRSSWLQRKSKARVIDVRFVKDEVTIKILQRKKINCLMHVSRMLDELHLDLQHIAGGHIGEQCSFLFNTRIYEGSSIYARATASRLMEVVDGQYAATPSCSDY